MYHLCTNLLKNINNYNELREHEIIKNPLNISICRILTSYTENQLLPKYIFFDNFNFFFFAHFLLIYQRFLKLKNSFCTNYVPITPL